MIVKMKVRFILISLFILLVLYGCSNLFGNLTTNSVSSKNTISLPIVSVFLSVKNNDSPNIQVKIKDIALLSSDGIWYNINPNVIEMSSRSINNGQILLAQSHIPEGSYCKIKFDVVSAFLQHGDNIQKLLIKKKTITVPILGNFSLSSTDSKCIFVSWDVKKSLDKNIFSMVVESYPQSIPLMTELLYVACPYINTIFIIRTDLNKVCGSFGVTGNPTYIALDYNNNKLYVLTTQDNFIKVYNINSYQLIDKISIPFTVQAKYMVFDKNDNYIFVLDPTSNAIVKLDVSSGSITVKDHIGYQPTFGSYFDKIHTLAITSKLSQVIYFLNPDTLNIIKSISTTNSPTGILLWNNLLYIANSNSNSISVYDINTDNMIMHFNVGIDPVRLYNGTNEIFVSNYISNSVDVLLPNQVGVVQEIPVGNGPVDMACSHTRHWLYVACHIDKNITVIDPSSSRVIKHIYLGSMPLGLVVLQ